MLAIPKYSPYFWLYLISILRSISCDIRVWVCRKLNLVSLFLLILLRKVLIFINLKQPLSPYPTDKIWVHSLLSPPPAHCSPALTYPTFCLSDHRCGLLSGFLLSVSLKYSTQLSDESPGNGSLVSCSSLRSLPLSLFITSPNPWAWQYCLFKISPPRLSLSLSLSNIS